MKKIISFALALALVFSIGTAVHAEEVTTPADDPVILEIVASGSLSFSGTTAYCSGSVTDPGKTIIATMTLYHGGTPVGSWGDSGTSYVDLYGTCTVVKGESYTLVISGTVNGTPFSTTPITKTC